MNQSNRYITSEVDGIGGGDISYAGSKGSGSHSTDIEGTVVYSSSNKSSNVGVKEEDSCVKRLRLSVVAVLVLAAVTVSCIVYLSLEASQTHEFVARFADQSAHVGHAVNSEVNSKLSAIDSLAITFQSYANSRDVGWPFVTLPEFPYRATSALTVGRGISLALLPIIHNETERIEWEDYSVANQHWRQEGMIFDAMFPNALGGGGGGHGMGHRRMQGMENHGEMDMGEDHSGGMGMNMDHNGGMDMNNMNMGDVGHGGGGGDMHTMSMSGEILNISEIVFAVDHSHVLPSENPDPVYLPLWQHVPAHGGFPWVNFDLMKNDDDADAVRHVVVSEDAVIAEWFDLADANNGHNFPPVDEAYIQCGHHGVGAHDHGNRRNLQHMENHGDSDMNMGDMEGHQGGGDMNTDPCNRRNLQDMNHGGDMNMDHGSGGGHGEVGAPQSGPASTIWYPLFDEFTSNRTEVAMLGLTVRWDSFFLPSLPPKPNGIMAVISNTCDQVFTFEITGTEVIYLGPDDLHEPEYDEHRRVFNIMNPGTSFSSVPLSSAFCPYTIEVYPSAQMEEDFQSNKPLLYAIGVGSIFLFAALVFTSYDCLVQRRQKYLADSATKSNAIVSSLFPANVRDRLFDNTKNSDQKKGSLNNYMLGSADQRDDLKQNKAPIADLFADATVMFGDIAGFTAWSSTREPSQVFILLETLYGAFDDLANEMTVFKVETIGDCYMAVTGLPNVQLDHATRMVRFAKGCLMKMRHVTEELEVTLGPDTTSLGLRVGLHSGPVTAGVLRGQKSRFQLFGDTVNTASRMESTGTTGRIQVSQSTADLILQAGKARWVTKRDEAVKAKGKGEVQTYWIKSKENYDTSYDNRSIASLTERSSLTDTEEDGIWVGMAKKDEAFRQRLIDWQVDLLSKLLRQILANRGPRRSTGAKSGGFRTIGKSNPRDEIAETINTPAYDPMKDKYTVDVDSVELDAKVSTQLKDMVTAIATLYHSNPFHNFRHACHVTMSASKLLSRVVGSGAEGHEDLESEKNLHEFTFGLRSDPLTQFAIVFSALVHDLNHIGVTNGQLVEEENRLAIAYKNKSVLEQNSIDLAWEIFSDPSYKELVALICPDETDYRRLRQLVVNCVMATDIFDKELLTFRNNRWDKAFHTVDSGSQDMESDLKATIVIEHIIQAADVSHTMQHWHVYTTWNERLFAEIYAAYKCGRGPKKDPATSWYDGELWFFDNYVIPLAKKLAECGVFGVSSFECLNYALENRKEWEVKGKGIVANMVAKYRDVDFSTVKCASKRRLSFASTGDASTSSTLSSSRSNNKDDEKSC